MKKIKSLITFFILFAPLFGWGQQLSNLATISLLTCSPGPDLYSIYGHTAFRIKDPVLGMDKVYNYGTFDFNEPNFYGKFVQGKLEYLLAVEEFRNFEFAYHLEGRGIEEQILNLTSKQKQDIYNFLEKNALPENRAYLYDFFYDNCSTRPRDVLETIFGDSLKFEGHENGTETFRQMINRYQKTVPWADFGIDLGLGLPTDIKVSSRNRMFLPDELYRAIQHASLGGIPLVKENNTILPRQVISAPPSFISPAMFFWILFGVIAVFTFFGKTGGGKTLDLVLFFITGLLGLALFLLWFATDHQATNGNLNLLWAWPTHLIAAVWAFKRNKKFNMYFFISAWAGFLIILFWILLPQDFHPAVAPIVLIITLRSWIIYKISAKPLLIFSKLK